MNRLTAKLVNPLTTKLVNRLTARLMNRMTAKLVDRLTAKLVYRLTAKLVVVNLVKLHLTKLKWNVFVKSALCLSLFNSLSPNSVLSYIYHGSFKGLSVREVMRIGNMITQV